MTNAARPATTLLLLRPADSPSGMEVFMLQRHRRSGFLPNAWVFPGGRVDPGDAVAHPAVLGGEAAVARLQQPADVARATLIAGVRETWEEAGIWLGERPPPVGTRHPLQRGEVSFAEVLDAHGSRVDLDQVQPWSWWVTPRAEPRRYDTRFLVARGGRGGVHDDIETTASRWICPAEAVALGQEGFPLAPPTWWSLIELARYGDLEAVFAAAPSRPVRPIEPVMRFFEHGMELLLPGHPDHPEADLLELPHLVKAEGRRWYGYRDGVLCT